MLKYLVIQAVIDIVATINLVVAAMTLAGGGCSASEGLPLQLVAVLEGVTTCRFRCNRRGGSVVSVVDLSRGRHGEGYARLSRALGGVEGWCIGEFSRWY